MGINQIKQTWYTHTTFSASGRNITDDMSTMMVSTMATNHRQLEERPNERTPTPAEGVRTNETLVRQGNRTSIA